MGHREEEAQVLVVGGSLSGLSSAVFLAHHGIDVVVVERHQGLLMHPRLRGITPRTVELYRQVGLEQAIRDQSFLDGDQTAFVPLRAETLADAYEPVADVDPHDGAVDPRTYSPCPYGFIDQDKLELLLRAHVLQLGAQLRFSTEMVSFEQDGEGVTAVVSDRTTGKDSAIRAGYLIGADGAKSPVREALAIQTDGPGVLFNTITALVDVDLAPVVRGRRIGIAYLQKPRPFSSMMPHDSEGKRWIFSTGFDPAQESIEDFTDERVADMVRAAAGVEGVQVSLRSQIPGTDIKVMGFPIGAQVARSYSAGRVFLVGDAARIQPPTGGFGGSTGVQDAHNLAWKLAAVLRGFAGPGLLATYNDERQPYGVLAMQQAFARFGDRMAGGAAVPMFDLTAVTIGYRYRSSAVLGAAEDTTPLAPAELTGQPGTRAPHLERADGTSTLDRYGKDFVLLSGPDDADWSQAASHAGDPLGVQVRSHTIGQDEANAHGIGPDGALLVRPDGFVAWRSQHPVDQPASTLTDVLQTVLSIRESSRMTTIWRNHEEDHRWPFHLA